jgi:hypothetical protein
MSSVISKQGQKSRRTAYLLTLKATTNDATRTNIANNTALTFAPSVVIPDSVIPLSALVALASKSTPDVSGYNTSLNVLFKDLGREIVVYDDSVNIAGSPHREVYRECQKMNGAGTEGISASTSEVRIFVKVSSSSGRTVDVARTG